MSANPDDSQIRWCHFRTKLWRWAESDLPKRKRGETSTDLIISQSDRLRQRTGRACIWIAVALGLAWCVVLIPHCHHLMTKDVAWSGAKPAWLAVSAPPVALIIALLGMAERFFTPTHLLHPRKSNNDGSDEIAAASKAGVDIATIAKPVEDLIKNASK